ncbi:MAG: SNF2-related protein [Bacteroidota bacterium]
MKITAYHAKYFAFELTKRSPSDSVEKLASTLVDAQVDLNPHQVEAALFAFRSPLSKGAILADEVGLGKTIEAGLVISQKWAEQKRKLLVIVPSNLRKQWSQELQDKFFLPSIIMEKACFDSFIKKGKLNPFEQDQIIICSYQFAKGKESYLPLINWDLVIIDEAHRLRNVYKPSNKIANSIKNSLANFPKILMTATPLQNSLLELFGLVSIIDDFTFGDLSSFKSQFTYLKNDIDFAELRTRLIPICKRTLRRQVLEYIKYTNRHAIVEEFYPTDEEQELYDLVSEYLQSPILYALPASQRQLMTLILRKLLASSTYAISGTLSALAEKLETNLRDDGLSQVVADIRKDFEEFDDIKDEWTEDENESDSNQRQAYTPLQIDEIKTEISSLKRFNKLARSIKINSKGNALITALTRGFEATDRSAPQKAVIFTESVRTQKYLFDILENTPYQGRILLFNGSNNDNKSKEIYHNWFEKHKGTDKVSGSKSADIRAALVEYFRDEAVIMIATEAAAEGINLQFCSIVVNYDLPWNPQRIEQRIGRCHRYGQRFDVVVVNFLNKKNAADQRVYQLLDEKFKLFNGVFGASDEVLGSIESGVDFEKRIVQIYQNCRTIEEIQTSFDELQQEMESEIDEKMQSTRQKLLENFDVEVHEKLRINLAESKEYLNKYENWLWEISRFCLNGYADFSDQEHSFYLKKNPFPNEKIHPGPYRTGKAIIDSNVFRIGHPLAQRIIQKCKEIETPIQHIEFDLSGSGVIVNVLQDLQGKAGWIKANNFTIESFEKEDHVLLCGITDHKMILTQEQCQRIFRLPAQLFEAELTVDYENAGLLKEILAGLSQEIIQTNAERNSGFFDAELEKLDKWAEDVKASLELRLKQLDVEIKTLKAEAKKILKLEEKVHAQRKIKEMEKRRNEMRMNLYQHQDDVDVKKESLISEIEARLKQNTNVTDLFTIRWTIK